MTQMQRLGLVLGLFVALNAAVLAIFILTREPGAAVAGGERASQAENESLPVLYPVPPFAFTTQDGETFGLEDTQGHIWVADMFFTTCGGPCPIMTSSMKHVQDTLAEAEDVHFVSISVDPDTDTPERLRQYGEHYGADFDRWHFLTGDIEAISTLGEEGFKLGSVDMPVQHSTRFVLVDTQGRIRGYYDGTVTDEVNTLIEDIRRLREETPADAGGEAAAA